MNKNLSWKLTVIIGILLVFLVGILGIPKDWSGKGSAGVDHRPHSSGPRPPWRDAPDPAGAGQRRGQRRLRQRAGAAQGRPADAQDQLCRHHQARSGEPSRNDRGQGRAAGSDQRFQEHYFRPAAGVRRQFGRGKFLDGFDEGAEPRRFEESRGRRRPSRPSAIESISWA